MQNSPAAILANYVEEMEIAEYPALNAVWSIFRGAMPDHPDNVVCFLDTTPVKDGRWMRTGEAERHYGVSVLVRSVNHTGGYAVCVRLGRVLDRLCNTEIIVDTKTYIVHNVSRVGSIGILGQEPGTKRRNLFSMNFLVSLTEN